jgi:predicted  nucleic acid-binding Zn-ribbon protein
MSWQVVAGVLGILIAAVVAAWYKAKTDAGTNLSEAARASSDAALAHAEAEIAQKNAETRRDLNDQIDAAKKIADDEARRRALLTILVKLRGSH